MEPAACTRARCRDCCGRVAGTRVALCPSVKPSPVHSIARAFAACACLWGLSACPYDDFLSSHGGAGQLVRVSDVADLPDRSAEDYADNTHGLITGGTLAAWRADWSAKRPRGIAGDLVILQVAPDVAASTKYIATSDVEGVRSYLVPTGSLVQTRDNGLSAFEAEIPDGAAADAFLKRYRLDPKRDLIVLAFERQAETQSSIVHSIGRAWLLLRYWGVDKAHIGILNGSIDWNATQHGLPLTEAASTPAASPPDDGTTTVRDLRVDNTGLVITLPEIVDLLTDQEGALDKAHVRIVDARGGAEALGLKKASSTGRKDCPSYDEAVPENKRCTLPFEGRIKGAQSVPWTQFLDTAANGFKFLPKAQVKELFDTQAGYDADAELTVQYCRTNQRSTVTGIVANVILGYPTRFYETSFIEWGHIAHGPTPSTQVVPADFAYRTDLPALTEHAELSDADAAAYVPGLPLAAGVTAARWVDGPNYNDDQDLSPISDEWPPVNQDPETTQLSVELDRAYLRSAAP
jgi:thiosulfate/3-mercaptopyruvate sulfurtransferase